MGRRSRYSRYRPSFMETFIMVAGGIIGMGLGVTAVVCAFLALAKLVMRVAHM